MNLLLFTPGEITTPLPRTDPRAEHVLKVLRRAAGDTFDVGLVNGPRGKAMLVAVGDSTLTLAFAWDAPPAPLRPLTLIIGLPRPQTARDILRDATTLGATALHFVATGRSDPSYAQSTLWSGGEWRRHLLAGAQQAFDTRIPAVTWTHDLASVLAARPDDDGATLLALDNYEATMALAAALPARADAPLVLAFGPERGWTADDRAQLRAHGFVLAHLGPRVLRSETAIIAALALAQNAR